MMADMISNKKIQLVVTKLFIRARKLKISLVFITQSFFPIPNNISLNSTHCFVMKVPNKRELQQIAINYSSDIDFMTLWIFTKNELKVIFFLSECYYSCIR